MADSSPNQPGFLKRLPGLLLRQCFFRLPALVVTVLPAWLLHTYLLVFKNEGFNGFAHWTSRYCNVEGNATTAFLCFGLGSAMFWSVVLSVLRCGPSATFNHLLGAPGRCLAAITAKDPHSRLGLALGLGLVLMGSNYFRLTGPSRLALSGATLFLGLGYPGTLLGQLLGQGLSSLKLRYPWLRSLDVALLVRSTVASVPVGFGAAWFLSVWTTDKLGLLALVYVGYTLFTMRKQHQSQPPAAGLLLWLGGWWLLQALTGQQAWGDDGGWLEATGGNQDLTWANVVAWWNSQGSGQAITQGMVPVVGAGLGAVMVPPVAPPRDGLDYKEDVTQHVTKDDEEFAYGIGIVRQGTEYLPADGRSQAFGYSVGESNDPKLKPGDIARAAHFSTTAPPGFELRIVKEEQAFGGDHKQFTVVAVAAPESAFAPGEIPAVVYAEATTPSGLVRGHMRYTIQVGTGKLHVEPMERDWLRADGEDRVQLVAYIEPTDRASITDEERRSTLELAAYGPNADWVGISPPGDGEFYRYWTIQGSKASDPKQMKAALEVELGLQGRFAGGLLQLKIPIRVLPPPRLEATPEVPFLVPKHQEEVEVEVEVVGLAAQENWELDPPLFKKGDQQAVVLDKSEKVAPGKFKLTFLLGKFDEDKSCLEASWGLKARETKGAETEELVIKVLAARPGVVYLSKTPFQVLADGKKEHELKLTVLRWNEQSKQVEVDEAALPKVEFEIVKEGEASKALEAASLQFKYDNSFGSQLGRHAIYKVSSLVPVPGMGFCQGKAEGFLKEESDEAFRRPLDLALALDAVSLIEKSKEEEWRLILDVLERYFKKPYEKAESSDKAGHLSCLIEIYNRWMKELERDKPLLGSHDLRQKRKLILEEAVKTWKAIGDGYLGDGKFYENLLRAAVTVDWFVDNAFTLCAKAALAWAGPLGSTVGSTVVNKVRAYLTKFVANAINGIPAAEAWKEIDEDLWNTVRDFTWVDAPELLANAVFGQPGAGGEVEVPLKVKIAIMTGFICYRFYRNYVDEDPVTKEKPVGFWRATWLTSQDIGMKFAGDAFGNYLKTLPFVRRGGTKVGDLKSPFGSPDAPSGGGDAPSAPATPSGGGDAPSAPATPSGGGDAPSAPATPSGGGDAPSAPATPSGGGDAPSAPATPSGGGDAPSAPATPSGSGDAPAAPATPSGGGDIPNPLPAAPHLDNRGIPRIDLS